jgi:hypothetical protein
MGDSNRDSTDSTDSTDSSMDRNNTHSSMDSRDMDRDNTDSSRDRRLLVGKGVIHHHHLEDREDIRHRRLRVGKGLIRRRRLAGREGIRDSSSSSMGVSSTVGRHGGRGFGEMDIWRLCAHGTRVGRHRCGVWTSRAEHWA